MTTRLAVIGNPVAHSRSPAIHARFARQRGDDVDYTRLLAPIGGFAETARAFAASGARGCNVTMPFKADAHAACAMSSERARRAGAVNTIRFDAGGWYGDNTDGAGLLRDIEVNAGHTVGGRRVLLLGAGGAAAGALGALIEARPALVAVSNRTPDRALSLISRHADAAALAGVTLAFTDFSHDTLDTHDTRFDLLINATAASLHGAPPPLPPGLLRPGALALDMMYGRAARPFLAWAEAQGAVPRDGLGMLVEQAAEAYALWFGHRPETGEVLKELRDEVEGSQSLST